MRLRQPPVASGRVGVRLRAGDAEEVPDHFGGLAHIELGDGIGQAASSPMIGLK